MKTFYSEYIQHCMRFYARYPTPKFHNDVDRQNWHACENALKGFSDGDRDILLFVYRERDTIPDNVYKVSIAKNIKQDRIWALIDELERKLAERRGLI